MCEQFSGRIVNGRVWKDKERDLGNSAIKGYVRAEDEKGRTDMKILRDSAAGGTLLRESARPSLRSLCTGHSVIVKGAGGIVVVPVVWLTLGMEGRGCWVGCAWGWRMMRYCL